MLSTTELRPAAGLEARVLKGAGFLSREELASRQAALTATEREVAELFLEHHSIRRIAELRHCSPATVRKHLENLRRKLGCQSSETACVLAGAD